MQLHVTGDEHTLMNCGFAASKVTTGKIYKETYVGRGNDNHVSRNWRVTGGGTYQETFTLLSPMTMLMVPLKKSCGFLMNASALKLPWIWPTVCAFIVHHESESVTD